MLFAFESSQPEVELKRLYMVVLGLICIATNVGAEEYEFLGTHYFASFYNCNEEALNGVAHLKEALEKASNEAGAHVLSTSEYVFPEGGVTIVSLLSESHASIHTYPEHGACFLDYFTCGTKTNFEVFEQVMKSYLKPKRISAQSIKRD